MKILLLGKLGMLGSCFLKNLSGSEDFEMYAFDKNDFDIADKFELETIFKRISPDFVINCAAYTAVDDCETNKDIAFKVNGEAPGEIASACRQKNSVLVHFSTDYVFDGSKAEGYKEGDATSPISIYGESKLEGERRIAENMDNYYIIRTAWLFGENGKNFVDTMINLGKTRNELDVVGDQIGSPTYTKDLANAVIEYFLAPYIANLPQQHERSLLKSFSEKFSKEPAGKPDFGIYHLTNSGHTSWCDFAKKIFEIMGMGIKVNEIISEQFPRPAKRPHYSILLNTKLDTLLRPWEEALETYLKLNYRVPSRK